MAVLPLHSPKLGDEAGTHTNSRIAPAGNIQGNLEQGSVSPVVQRPGELDATVRRILTLKYT